MADFPSDVVFVPALAQYLVGSDGTQPCKTPLGVANGVATLDGTGKVPAAQLPAIAITDTFVVASEVAMLALTVEVGDVCVRTDLSQSFILRATPGSVLGNWQLLEGPAGPAGPTGPAGPPGTTTWAGITDKPATFAPSAHTHAISDVTGLQGALDAKTSQVTALSFTISTNDGSVPAAGTVAYFTLPFAGTFQSWTLEAGAGVAGSAVIDLWRHASNKPTVSDTITAAAKPTLTASERNANQPCTGWGTAFTAGDRFAVRVDSAATATVFRLTLNVLKA